MRFLFQLLVLCLFGLAPVVGNCGLEVIHDHFLLYSKLSTGEIRKKVLLDSAEGLSQEEKEIRAGVGGIGLKRGQKYQFDRDQGRFERGQLKPVSAFGQRSA